MDIEIGVIAARATVVDKVEVIKVIASEAWARVEAPFKIRRALECEKTWWFVGLLCGIRWKGCCTYYGMMNTEINNWSSKELSVQSHRLVGHALVRFLIERVLRASYSRRHGWLIAMNKFRQYQILDFAEDGQSKKAPDAIRKQVCAEILNT